MRPLPFLVFAALVLPVHAGLSWTRTLVELDLSARPAETVATFPFRNAGTNAVRVAMVVASCDCLTPKLPKETFAPGERGEIRVAFKPDGATGRFERTVAVITDDAPENPTLLRLRITLPERARSRGK